MASLSRSSRCSGWSPLRLRPTVVCQPLPAVTRAHVAGVEHSLSLSAIPLAVPPTMPPASTLRGAGVRQGV